jgi:hypothetical protein
VSTRYPPPLIQCKIGRTLVHVLAMPTQNEAPLEAYASCPPSARIFYTLEIWQSSFAQAARVCRQCRRRYGPRHRGGRAARWRPDGDVHGLPFTADYPEQREGQPPTSKIKIDNVNGELVPKILAALGVGSRAYCRRDGSRCFPRPAHRRAMGLAVAQLLGFACHVDLELFGRELPHVGVPADLSKRRVLESIDRHPERAVGARCLMGLAAW